MNQIFEVTGNVLDVSSPVDLPGKNYTISFITLQVENDNATNDYSKYGYYVFKYFRYYKRKTINLKKGQSITCNLKRTSNLWKVDGFYKYKKELEFVNDSKIDVGSHPIVFENYTCVGPVISHISANSELTEKNDDLPF